MTRAFARFAALLVFACSGRMSFDTHTLAGTGGRADDESGGVGAVAGGAPAGGASTGGARADDCGGTRSLPSPPDGDAGEAADDDESEELECEETSSCYPCATHLDCAYRWLCDPVLQVCVECLTDQNCPQGTCDVRLRKCH
jgi:hypothetical protein